MWYEQSLFVYLKWNIHYFGLLDVFTHYKLYFWNKIITLPITQYVNKIGKSHSLSRCLDFV